MSRHIAVITALSNANFLNNFPKLRDPATVVAPLATAFNLAEEAGLLILLAGIAAVVPADRGEHRRRARAPLGLDRSVGSAYALSAGVVGSAARVGRDSTLTRFAAGSRNIIDEFPQGWVVGGSTQSTPSAAIRGYSASTSLKRKSKMMSLRPGGGGPSASRCSVNRRRGKPTEAGPTAIST